MKDTFLKLPAPLRKQILLRLAGAGLGVAMLLLVLAYGGTWQFFLPCVIVAVLCLGSAFLLFDRCVKGKYIRIHGICSDMEQTAIRRRIKALYILSDDHRIRLVGVRPIRNLKIGDAVDLYVAENTAVYETDGHKVICSYIALVRSTAPQEGEKKEIPIQ